MRMNKRIIPFILSLLFCAFAAYAQPSNDECELAIFLGEIEEFCSEDGDFTTFGATASPETLASCWFTDHEHDVWFSFRPTSPAIFVQLFGKLAAADTNIPNPSLAIYQGPCNNLTELACGSVAGAGTDIVELSVSQLTIGAIYYLRVDARESAEGDFRLCLRSFVPTPTPESDCPDAVVLCDKTGFNVPNLNNIGNLTNELTGPCVFGDQDQEQASVWYVWTCETSGTLEFTLTPNNPNGAEEDLDFVVYEFPGGLDDCDNRIPLRCMLSGESEGNAVNQNSPCWGPTGLAAGETDISELAGCQSGDNNFVAPIDMVAGTSYGLIVNNFSESSFGFEIEFGGTGTFLGPAVDFDIVALDNFECDKSVIITDDSDGITDEIVDWSWTFGVGADPPSANGEGPHEVLYSTFGEKFVSLTITTDRGCTVNEIIPQFIEPCCKDTSTLAALAFGNDVLCAGELGSILGDGTGGVEFYEYSLDGVNFQPSPFFPDQVPGSYMLFVQDRKGCIADTTVLIDQPPPLIVDILTEDLTIDLGQDTFLTATFTPPDANVTITWDPTIGLSCTDCLDPDVTPPGTTTYTITVEDPNGCISRDVVTITTEIVRPYYAPTVFTPEDVNGQNTRFNIGFGPQIRSLNKLRVYDRWGNLMYEGTDLAINDFSQGWDGRFRGQDVVSGVYTWIGEAEFIDDEILFLTGSVTVLR